METGAERAPSFSFPLLGLRADQLVPPGHVPLAPLLAAQPQTAAIPGTPPSGGEEQAPLLPPLPARLRLQGSDGLPPDDMAGALASALTSAAAAGGSSGEQPSRQMSLDAVAALLTLPKAISSATQGGPPAPQQRDGLCQPDRHGRGEGREQQPSSKRAKTAGAMSPAPAALQMPQALMPGGPSWQPAAPHQLQAQAQGLQAALLAQLLGAPASQPSSPQASPGPPAGSTAPSSRRSPRQHPTGQQGQQQGSIEPRLGGHGGAAAAPGDLEQQLLLALLSALPGEQSGPRADAARLAPGPATPKSTGLDNKAAGASAAAGGAESPEKGLTGSLLLPAGQVPLLGSRATSPGPAAAAAAMSSDPAAAAAHRLWASAAAALMPPMPPAPPVAAAAAAASRAGFPLSPQQRQAVFEHSVGVLIWIVQQLQHQAFQQGTAGALQQQQLLVLQTWAQKVGGCLRQMQQGWRELMAAIQGAVGEQAGQLQQHDAVLQTVLGVQQQLAQALLAQQQQAQQTQHPEGGAQQAQQQLGEAAAGAAGMTAEEDPPGAAAAIQGAGQAQQLAQENAALRLQVVLLRERQEEQHSVVQQMGAGLLHERQQRQQLQAALAALQARVQQLAGGPAGPAPAAAPAAAAGAEGAPQPAGLQAEHQGPGSGHVADLLARAGSSGALL